MRPLIEHIVEPTRLLLFWQARESSSRSRYHVGELVKRDDGSVLLKYDFGGDEFKAARKLDFNGYPAFDIRHAEHSSQVLEAFMRRLPPRNRRDFVRYIELKGIPSDARISDFALLGYSGAKLPYDGFEIVHPFDNPPKNFEFVIEVAGFRHESEVLVDTLERGDSVRFISEPDNIHDKHAIRIEHEGKKIGYVARSNLPVMNRMIGRGADIDGEIFHINGTSERPLIYVMTRIRQVEAIPA